MVRQSVDVILEIRRPQHGVPCFASHARADRAAWQGGTSSPVASPRAGVFPNPCTPGRGLCPCAPQPLRPPLRCSAAAGTGDVAPLEPCAGWQRRAAQRGFAPPGPGVSLPDLNQSLRNCQGPPLNPAGAGEPPGVEGRHGIRQRDAATDTAKFASLHHAGIQPDRRQGR